LKRGLEWRGAGENVVRPPPPATLKTFVN